jgi:hypothetical protein
MRVSDADRSEIAEALSKHFADGRLDQSEFDERMARAMSAKTRADFAGLLDDLPPVPGPMSPPNAPAHAAGPRGGRSQVMLVVLGVALFVLATSSWLWSWWHPHGLAILLVIVAVVLVGRHRHHHHGYGRSWHQAPPPPPPSGQVWP